MASSVPTSWSRTTTTPAAAGFLEMPLSAPGFGQHPYSIHFREPSPSEFVRQRGQIEVVLGGLLFDRAEAACRWCCGGDAQELADRHGYSTRRETVKISAARKKIHEAIPNREDFDVQPNSGGPSKGLAERGSRHPRRDAAPAGPHHCF
jgi:hypothetical protein